MARPLPSDALTCARLARSLILALHDAPDHPLVIAAPSARSTTVATIERLLRRAKKDPELRQRVRELRAAWTARD